MLHFEIWNDKMVERRTNNCIFIKERKLRYRIRKKVGPVFSIKKLQRSQWESREVSVTYPHIHFTQRYFSLKHTFLSKIPSKLNIHLLEQKTRTYKYIILNIILNNIFLIKITLALKVLLMQIQICFHLGPTGNPLINVFKVRSNIKMTFDTGMYELYAIQALEFRHKNSGIKIHA